MMNEECKRTSSIIIQHSHFSLLSRVGAPALFLAMAVALHVGAATPDGDRVVAIVNQDVITEKDVRDRAAAALNSLESGLSPAGRAERSMLILLSALRALVDEKLLLAEARRIQKDNPAAAQRMEAAVERHLEKERRAAGSVVAFREAIQREGLTYSEYVERLRNRIFCEILLHEFVDRNVSVSPAEMLEYYRRHRDQFQEPPQARYRQIFVRADKYESRAKAGEAAEYLAELLRKEYDFAKLTRENSDGPRAEEGGLWDFMRQGLRPKPIDDLIFSLPIGELGGPVATEIGFTLVKVEARKPGRTIPFEEVQADIRATLVEQERRRRYDRLIRRLEDENSVEIK